MIKLDNLCFGYTSYPIINELSLTLKSGQIHGFFGKNGAGKTTLLKLISGHLYSQSGESKVFGHDPKLRDPSFLADCFFLTEEIYTPPVSLKRYIAMYAPFYPNFRLDDFFKFLVEFELDRDIHLHKLSMGQRKKAIIAFALACNTRLIIMDEPTNGLDIPSKRQFRRILSTIIKDDRIFLISTHQVRDLHSIIDSVTVLDKGQIIFNQSLASIAERLHFQISRVEPSMNDVFYYERVPGGYLALAKKSIGDNLEVDIEILFNAITANTAAINQQFPLYDPINHTSI